MHRTQHIYCCGCTEKVPAKLVGGMAVYPHREDLHDKFFWKCPKCGNFVGCHHKDSENPTRPLGCIPTQRIKKLRQEIHKVLDPIWKNKHFSRGKVYAYLTECMGFTYHTANLRTPEECYKIMKHLHEFYEEHGIPNYANSLTRKTNLFEKPT